MKYLLGIDFGGGASKATLINTKGDIIAENTVEYPTLYPSAGACEQDPGDWIAALAENCKAIINNAGIMNLDILAVAIDSATHTSLICDKDFKLIRNEGIDESGDIYRFMAIDNQGTIETKTLVNVSDLSVAFSALDDDYIYETLNENGFERDNALGYHEKALEFIEKCPALKGTTIHEVIKCLLDGSKIEDDITVTDPDNVKGFMYDFFLSLYEYAPETIELLEKQENKKVSEIISIILDVADTDSIGGKEDNEELFATLYQQMETQDDILWGFHQLLETAALYED